MKYFLVIIIVLLVLVGGVFYLKDNPSISTGSIETGQEYNATTTRTIAGTALTSRALKTVSGSLGSVIITGAGAGVINLYDSTTTPATAETYTTVPLLASIPASAAAGTYVFDSAFSNGLYVELTGTAATSTITWR